MKIANLIMNEDGTAAGYCDESGEMIDLSAIGDSKELYYSNASLQPLAMMLDRMGIAYKVLASNMAIRVGKAKFVSLEKWRIKDFTIENLQKLEARFGGKELPSGVGIAVARHLPLDWAKDKLHVREAILMSTLHEDYYFPAYRAGIISNMTDSGSLIENVSSYDISSAYPAAILEGLFPSTDSIEEDPKKLKLQKNGMITGLQGFIGRFTLTLTRKQGVGLSPLPSLEDGENYYSKNSTFDNIGLIKGAVEIAASLPEMLAIAETYDINKYTIHEVFSHDLGHAGDTMKSLIKEYYENKKRDAADKIFINTMAGMMARSPIKDIRGEINEESIEKAVARYNDSKFPMVMGTARKMDQRWAAYMVSWTRLKMIKAAQKLTEVGAEVVYADTDSIKSVGDTEAIRAVFENLNSTIVEKVGDSGIGQWGDETAEYAGGARFFGKRFYIKADTDGHITPVLAGFDIDASTEILNKFTMNSIDEKTPAARTRWYISRDSGMPKKVLLLSTLGGE